MRIEIPIKDKARFLFEKAVRLSSDYVDLFFTAKECVLAVNSRSYVFAGKLELDSNVETYQIRISTQVLKQIHEGTALMRIEDTENVNMCLVSFYAQGMVGRPTTVLTRRSIVNDVYYTQVVREALEDELFFGSRTDIAQILPVVKAIRRHVLSLTLKDLMISDGVVFIDAPEFKMFCDLSRKINVFIPDVILNVLGADRMDRMQCDLLNGYFMVKTADYLLGWRQEIVNDGGAFDSFKKMTPQAVYTANLSDLYLFLNTINIAGSREQECYIDLDNKLAKLTEVNVGTFNVPIVAESLDGVTLGTELKLPLKTLKSILKCVDGKNITICVYAPFIVFQVQQELDGFGLITLQYLLMRLSEY